MNPELIDRAEEHESAGANIGYEAMRNRCKPRRRRKLLAIAADHFTIADGLRAMAALPE